MIAPRDVLPLELAANERLDHVVQVLQASLEVPRETRVAVLELLFQPLDLPHERAEAELARNPVRKPPFLEPLLDVADPGTLAGLAQHALEPAAVRPQERPREG